MPKELILPKIISQNFQPLSLLKPCQLRLSLFQPGFTDTTLRDTSHSCEECTAYTLRTFVVTDLKLLLSYPGDHFIRAEDQNISDTYVILFLCKKVACNKCFLMCRGVILQDGLVVKALDSQFSFPVFKTRLLQG